jgi:class 3 adenylate cyclase/predicted ATPase
MDVGRWLRSLGLDQYEANFRENKIDAEVLPRLTADDLKDIGVSAVGDRRRLLDAIATLAGATPTEAFRRAPQSAPPKSAQLAAERRPVTVMFCDLVGSTSLAAKLDAEDWRDLVDTYLDEASAVVGALGGHVLKRLGDGLMALFGYPRAQENDAERAVRAALAIQRSLAEINARNAKKGAPELAARIGLELGPVVVDASGEVFGEAPNVAARVQALAEPNSVLVTANVQRQVAGLFVAEEQGGRALKGVPAPVMLYRIVRASGGGRRVRARAATALVGRSEELDLLARRWERARSGQGQFVQIVGEPGIGKSRLVEEFHARLGETPHTWAEFSSSQLLQNTPLHPIAEWGRQRFGDADTPAGQRFADLENTLQLIGLDPAEHAPFIAPLVDIPPPPDRAADLPPEELRRRQLAAVITWFLAGARSQPVALAFEDLHWADPTSLDLMKALAERGAQAPMLILATTRPEFRPPWSLRPHHSVISLGPLNRADVAQMVGELAARHALSKEVVEGVSERTGGVPLFVEEVTRLLLERGERGGLQAVPPTLQQSLAARLDRLGEAREVAQIGAVLGRDFPYALLAVVAAVADRGGQDGVGHPALQTALDRLVDADLLFVEGAGAQATYRFKHALIQDAAYESLLKSRRQALHRRTAEILRDDPVRAAAEPELVAHHFTEAGLNDLAIEWWGKAGDQALRRSAFQEAIAHLGKAIAMADKAAGVSVPRLQLHVAYGNALISARGYPAPETMEAFARVRELASGDEDAPTRLAANYGLWGGSFVRGELPAIKAHAAAFLRDVAARPDSPEAGVAHRILGSTHWFAGEYREARSHLERALALFKPGRDDDLALRFGHDVGVAAMLILGLVVWPLGDVERAISLVGGAEARTASLTYIGARAYGAMFAAMFNLMRGDLARAALNAVELARLAREHDLPQWRAYGVFLEGLACAQNGVAGGGLEVMRRGIELLRDQNALMLDGLIKIALAEAEARAGDVERAVAVLDEALGTCDRAGHRTFEAELHRVRGEMLLKRDPTNPATAEEALQTATAIAKQQGSRSFGLRAASSLAKLYQSTGRPADAHAILAPALEGFSPTPEMPEIAEAQGLLVALSQTEDVKVETARRQRLTQLQVSYGNALIAARGFGAPETTEAFARAREAAHGETDALERLAADYGLWASSYTRGDLPSMRAHSASFVRDVEAKPDSPEAGVADRIMGVTCWFAGEFIQARRHLERALSLFEPGRDDDLAFRFGLDVGAAAMANLAISLWALGDVERATSLMGRMHARVDSLAHVNTRAFGKMNACMFELMRRDPRSLAQNAVELARLVREHDLIMFRGPALFLEGWADAAAGALEDGLDKMRRGIELLREQNVLWFDGLLRIAYSEAEHRASKGERAVALLDEGLAIVDRTGYRAFEAELHRVRGELLLRRDLADPATAEEALQTATTVAKQQGSRSFGLRAASSLAKLYQSTGRPADAHAILAPALEGFSPTPEMPEIAEAQTLLAALAGTDEVKAAETHRQRRLHLQTAYGQAVMYSRGFAAAETKSAFARATELAAAGGIDDFSARFAAFDGQCRSAIVRGELRSAWELASSFLREAENAARIVEAGAALRSLGLIAYFRGDFVESRTHLERALNICDVAYQEAAPERFGDDIGAIATSYLALTSWQLGEVERARELIDAANKRADEIGHITSKSIPLYWRSYLEILHGDPSGTLNAAEALAAVAEAHAMTHFSNMAEMNKAWARGRLDDPTVGAAQFRRALKAHLDSGFRIGAGFYTGLLAELEAEILGADRALERIDEALSAALQVDYRCDLAFFHRLRGDILLKRDSSNPAPTEEAYKTAIAIAKGQAARSPVLLASLSLAKLYRSTGRPAQAHAVLLPALEGFAPTPEMPEIAEAQALIAALAPLLPAGEGGRA